jgi:tetratricopeptide (TPR) repeat protein
MDRIETSSAPESLPHTVGDDLDQLETLAGRIGMISAKQAFKILYGLDSAYSRIQEMEEDSPSRKLAETQLNDISARLHTEANQFLRNLGGAEPLRQARETVKPPKENDWWYVDVWLSDVFRSAMRRVFIYAGAAVAFLVIIVLLYNRFLAPDPKAVALYGHQQSTRDLMMSGDFKGAMKEVDQGLQVDPKDPTLLIFKGLLLEHEGQIDQANQEYAAAQQATTTREDFLLTRGEGYIMVNQPDKALADAQEAVKADPQSAPAYLLLGQVHEAQMNYQDALNDYNNAFDAAQKGNHPELAALARTRVAMLLQQMNSQITPFAPQLTPTTTQ